MTSLIDRLAGLGDKVKQRPWHPDVVALVYDLPEIIQWVTELVGERDEARRLQDEAEREVLDMRYQRDAANDRTEAAESSLAKLRAEMDEAVRVLGFAASCIKSGEAWSPTCETMFAPFLSSPRKDGDTLDRAGALLDGVAESSETSGKE